MWQHYRKTLLPVQAIIVIVCLLLYWVAKLPLPGVLVFLATMEVGAIVGAWWAARLKRRITTPPDKLPLHNRL